MDSTMVIKVKYGDTLRRFTASVNDNKELDVDISGLRAKIQGLFNFPPEFDLSLTYIDEDGDVVTLIDDNDLHDVMRQQLKFLRIDVKLKKSDKLGKPDAKSNSNSSPLKTFPEQPKSNTGDAEVLKSVGQAISKPSLDLASKPASSNHMAADLSNICPKLGPSVPNPVSQAPDLKSNSQSGSLAPPNDRSVQEVLLKFNNALKTNEFVGFGNSSRSVTAPVQPTDLNSDPFARYNLNEYPITRPDLNLDPFANNAPKPTPYGVNYNLYGYPFARPDLNLDPSVNNSPKPPPYGAKPIQMSWVPNGTSHIGIICDGCEINPINGPRYKSKVKHDYDLCSLCFSKMGNEQDYIRIDHPIPRRDWSQFSRVHDLYPPASAPAMPRHVKGLLKAMNQNHDSCFITDLSILDGTMMAPSTPFTKIWRMQNSGNTPWLQGVKLVWVQGEKFGNSVLAEIKVPSDGVPVDGVLDVAVDFTAPAVPGRYISYWRMESPSGVKFGQTIWVLIEVDDSLNDSLCDSFRGLNLNLPPADTDFVGPKTVDVNVKPEPVMPVAVEQTKGDGQLNDKKPVAPAISASSLTSSTVSYPVIDLSPAEIVETQSTVNGVPSSRELEESLLRELVQMGFNQVELNKEILRINKYDMQCTLDDLCGVVTEWDSILEELNDMGFTDVETNKRLLKKNNGSIKGVVMDLFAEALA